MVSNEATESIDGAPVLGQKPALASVWFGPSA